MRGEAEILIGLGANVAGAAGGPRENIAAAIASLRKLMNVGRVSRLYENPAFPAGAGPDFVNAVLIARAGPGLEPRQLLEALLAIERDLGRVRVRPLEPRPIDLDILDFGGEVSAGFWQAAARGESPPDGTALILPHPRLHLRRSVLVPLVEIAPEWRHPSLGQSACELLAALDAAIRG